MTLYRDGQRVDSVKLRYRSEPLPLPRSTAARRRSRGARRRARTSDALGVAPGQTACLMDGDLVVGHGTIAASLASA